MIGPASTLGLAFAVFMTMSNVTAAEPLRMTFNGRVEPSRTVIVANHLDGVVDEVRFTGGEDVTAGDVLFVIDPKEFRIALAAAEADLAAAEATLRLAEDDTAREAELRARGTGSRVAALRAEVSRDVARAERDRRQAAREAAALALDRAFIEAPISGRISPPRVAEGAFVEAKAGTALATISVVDPVRVAYAVPYADRVAALDAAGVATARELFERVTVQIVQPSGETYPYVGRPIFESASADPQTGTLTTWATVPNPDGRLVPGIPVSVHATIETVPPR